MLFTEDSAVSVTNILGRIYDWKNVTGVLEDYL